MEDKDVMPEDKDVKKLIKRFRLKRGVEFRREGARVAMVTYETSNYLRTSVKQIVIDEWEGGGLHSVYIPVSVEEAAEYLEEGRVVESRRAAYGRRRTPKPS
jgi:hypothetical protein